MDIITNNTRFIKAIKFNRKFRSYSEGQLIEFKSGLNIIVGDQGCGKSSLFYSIINWEESGISMARDGSVLPEYRFMDTESMNPRLKDSFEAHRKFEDFGSLGGYQKAELDSAIFRFETGINQQSHGEVILPLILSSTEKGLTYFVDEPEAGLSIRSQYKIAEHFKELAKYSQLFVATHSLVLMETAKKVLSLEHKRWMPTQEFIESQKT
jgi:predicted ATPase